jgi:hypothetical protein
VNLQGGIAPFDFIGPLKAPLSDEDGSAALLAASHPYQQTVSFEFPVQLINGQPISAGHARDIHVELPPGLIGNPSVSPVLCTQVQLASLGGGGGCPDASAVGTIDITALAGSDSIGLSSTPLYNMVPPPGYPAMLGTDVATVGLSLHLLASVRTESDYGVSADVRDVIALTFQPVFGSTSQLWNDPSSPLHDHNRGGCAVGQPTCAVEPQQTAFWTMPSQCDGEQLITKVSANSWEEPGVFKESSYASADLGGAPVTISGCNQLKFEPTIEASPTTNLADSPSGLNFTLHQPQDTDKEHRGAPPLRDASVTLPAGMSANPSQADGLAACSPAQIGMLTAVGETPGHFSAEPAKCPGASRLGEVEVTTPLLAERSEGGTKLVVDPETGDPVLRPLSGSVFLAEPFDNPFNSLLAIYLTVEDPKTGTFAKLAGQVEPDPQTGQLTTRFEESPQLPLEDVELHLFGGARAPLITPPACGTHTTTSTLMPWSAPETPNAHPESSFGLTASPDGGSCPGSADVAANKPSFQAGTLAPQAGAYSSFVLKLSREDGSQRIARIDTVLSPGLTGKLAGVGRCSEAGLAQAKAREHPNEGILEKNNPSCPDSSKLGTVDVAAGAGPTPLHVEGTVYLAGPYKGAPLSLAVITPAIAGPFDLGAVLLRTALHVDPATAQIHAVSDPIPQILQGIPLALRSVALKMDRPNFTLNPTSCDPMAITGSALSALNQSASLTTPFQVGGCQGLPFKPKLSLKLKGGTKRAAHPKLIASLKAKGGEANIAKAQVKLPPSAFLDQAHIRTICTRVQFAADQCPKGSIYGKAKAITPLLDDPLSGNVYLRSSNNKLPDLIDALKGPDSLPIEIELAGRTDSVKGALRNTFEAVPDAPVSSFRLELFGGRRGLVVNSRNLCAHRYRAEVNLDGQNGKVFDTEPVVKSDCGSKRKRKRR